MSNKVFENSSKQLENNPKERETIPNKLDRENLELTDEILQKITGGRVITPCW